MARWLLPFLAFAVLCACDRCSGTDAPPTARVEATPPPPPPPEPAYDATAWCAAIIDINTRHGYMVDKEYKAVLAPEPMRAIVTEYVERFDELRDTAPPELRESMAALDELNRRVLREGEATSWDPPPVVRPSEAENAALGAWLRAQEQQCGITFARR